MGAAVAEEVARRLAPALAVFVELAGAEEPGPAALAAQCAGDLARLSPHLAAGALPLPRSMWLLGVCRQQGARRAEPAGLPAAAVLK